MGSLAEKRAINDAKPDLPGIRRTQEVKAAPKGGKAGSGRMSDVMNLLVSALVFGMGLILFFRFHAGDGAHRKEWLGPGKWLWLDIHRASAIGFLIGFTLHIQRHWKYLKIAAKRWRISLLRERKSTTGEQITLLVTALVVIWAGFCASAAMQGATLGVRSYHRWIDVHNIVGFLFLAGMGVHVKR